VFVIFGIKILQKSWRFMLLNFMRSFCTDNFRRLFWRTVIGQMHQSKSTAAAIQTLALLVIPLPAYILEIYFFIYYSWSINLGKKLGKNHSRSWFHQRFMLAFLIQNFGAKNCKDVFWVLIFWGPNFVQKTCA